MGVCLRPEASAELKLKLGRVDTALRCDASPPSAGEALACMEDGLMLLSAGCRLRAGEPDGCMGNEKSGLGIISIVGPPGTAIELTLLVCLPWPGATTSAILAN